MRERERHSGLAGSLEQCRARAGPCEEAAKRSPLNLHSRLGERADGVAHISLLLRFCHHLSR